MGKRILSIDDEEVIHRVLRAHLKDTDYELYTVLSGAEGLELAQTVKFDLFLCDLKLVNENGLDIIRELKGKYWRTHIIALTGLVGDEIVVQARKAGANEYLSKPFEKAKLLAMIDKHISRF